MEEQEPRRTGDTMRQKTRCAAVAGIIAIAVCGTLTFNKESRGRAGAAGTSAKAGKTSEKQFCSRQAETTRIKYTTN